MDKNILLGVIIVICTIYILSINQIDKLDNVVISKYHKRIKGEEKTYLDHFKSVVSYLPKIKQNLDLDNYEIYKNIKENVVYYIGKKNTPIQTDQNSMTSTITKYYESMKNYVNNGMVSVQTNGSKNKDDWTIDPTNNINNIENSVVEKNEINDKPESNFFDINVVKWVICLFVSVGVVYIIVAYGEKVFKNVGANKLNKYIELDPEDTELLDSIKIDPKNGGYNNIYYIGGYNTNLYSE